MEEEVTKNETKNIDTMVYLTTTMAILSKEIQTMNDVLLVLVHNAKKNGIEIPEWKSQKDVEADIAPTLQACIDMMKEAYGRDKDANS